MLVSAPIWSWPSSPHVLSDFNVDADFQTLVLSINTGRNCLVHRGGIVQAQDLDTQEGMLVRWRKWELVVVGVAGERVVTPPAVVSAGERAGLREVGSSRLFKLGDRVVFSTQEFSELCSTLFRFGQTLVASLEAYARARNIPFTDGQPPRKPDTAPDATQKPGASETTSDAGLNHAS